MSDDAFSDIATGVFDSVVSEVKEIAASDEMVKIYLKQGLELVKHANAEVDRAIDRFGYEKAYEYVDKVEEVVDKLEKMIASLGVGLDSELEGLWSSLRWALFALRFKIWSRRWWKTIALVSVGSIGAYVIKRNM